MKSSSDGNHVEFVLDGDAFFARFHALLSLVSEAPPAANTYVRLAYWWMQPDATLKYQDPDTGASESVPLVEALKTAADNGHRIEIILWLPNSADRTIESLAIAIAAGEANQLFSGTGDAEADLEFLNGIAKAHEQLRSDLDGYADGKITVYLERYDGWWGSAAHQKMAIFCNHGCLTVLTGGLNLANPYYGDVPHQRTLWHDTALEVRGPATVDVEKEWVRRWDKGYTQLPLVHSQPPVIGGAIRSIVSTFVDTTWASLEDQPITTAEDLGATISVNTTNSESWFTKQLDIKERLLEEIHRAKKYMYFENFAFFDPELVAAVHERLAGRNPPKVFVVIAAPVAGDPIGYLNFVSFLKLATARATSVTAAGPNTYDRDAMASWTLTQSASDWTSMQAVTSTFSNRWMEDDALLVVAKGSRQPISIPLTEIRSITGGLRFYSPEHPARGPVYVHSKLALFDDDVAMVGTSNFDFRSQNYDGEISLFVSGNSALVTRIRTALWDHYSLTTPDNFDRDVDSAPATRTYMRRLEITDFPTRTREGIVGSASYLNFTLL